jgi:hypothetical protein
MSKPRVELHINGKTVSFEEVKRLGFLNGVSIREMSPGIWSYSDSVGTKWADVTWGGGRINGVSFEVLSRYLTKDMKLFSEDVPDDEISGMFDIMIYGLDNPIVATISNRHGMEAILIESPAYENCNKESENNVEIDFLD